MPILPIDLQTMLAQMDRVGKEQAVQKEISPHHQSLQATELSKKAAQHDHSVNQTHELGEGVEKVKEEQEREKKRKGAAPKKGKQEMLDNKQKEIFEDPDLGRHINLSG